MLKPYATWLSSPPGQLTACRTEAQLEYAAAARRKRSHIPGGSLSALCAFAMARLRKRLSAWANADCTDRGRTNPARRQLYPQRLLKLRRHGGNVAEWTLDGNTLQICATRPVDA